MDTSNFIGETTEKHACKTAGRMLKTLYTAAVAVVLLSGVVSTQALAKETSHTSSTLSDMDNFTLTVAVADNPITSGVSENEQAAKDAENHSKGTKKTSYADKNKVIQATAENFVQSFATEDVSEAKGELRQALNAATADKAEQDERQKIREEERVKEEAERKTYLASEQGKREQLVEAAKSRLGVPYVYGGTDPENGMDCSGFVQWCYSQIGMDIPRTTYSQHDGAIAVIDVADAKPGDILYSGGHVGLYIGDGTFIHEPQTGDVCRKSTDMGQFYSALRYL